MAKRKVIKFVFQGHRQVKSNEWYPFNDSFAQWKNVFESINDEDVYHRIETEEEILRWRAEDGDAYYGVTSYYKIVKGFEQNSPLDDMMYDSGNYFQTEEQAQEYIDHCKKFFENN